MAQFMIPQVLFWQTVQTQKEMPTLGGRDDSTGTIPSVFRSKTAQSHHHTQRDLTFTLLCVCGTSSPTVIEQLVISILSNAVDSLHLINKD